MLVVGLTGGIGSGKSTVSALLAERGAVVLDADVFARQVVEPGAPAHAAVVERFGPGVLLADGRIDRPALAEVVFADPQARAELNAIIHPAVRDAMGRRLAEEAGSGDDRIVVLDIPLLVESGRDGMAGVIVVDCPEDVAVRRLVERRGMAEEDARRRVEAQADRPTRLARANLVIDNSGSMEHLEAEVKRAWARITELARHAAGGP